MKWFIVLGIIILMLLTACTQQQKQPDFNSSQCSAYGYVYYTEVNKLINLTNSLIVVDNICFQAVNKTPVPQLGYIVFNGAN